MTRVIIVVEGGVVKNVVADGPVEVSLIDHDNLYGSDVSVGDLPVEVDSAGVDAFYKDPRGYAGLGD